MGALIWSRKSRREALSLSFTLLFFYSPSRECGGRTIPFKFQIYPWNVVGNLRKLPRALKAVAVRFSFSSLNFSDVFDLLIYYSFDTWHEDHCCFIAVEVSGAQGFVLCRVRLSPPFRVFPFFFLINDFFRLAICSRRTYNK